MLHALSGILIEGVGVHGRPGGKPTWGPLAHAALRHLIAAGHEPDLFIGTSAGAINAILFAAGAHLPADEQADTALAVWRSVEIEDVFRPLLRTGPGTIARWAGQLCRIPGMRLTSLVDTAPLARTAHRLIDWTQLAANLDGGKASLAVVTTSAATKRTVIFVDGSRPDPLPPSDTTRPIDYLGVRITDEHVLGSAAIPALFPAVEVSTPRHCTRLVRGRRDPAERSTQTGVVSGLRTAGRGRDPPRGVPRIPGHRPGPGTTGCGRHDGAGAGRRPGRPHGRRPPHARQDQRTRRGGTPHRRQPTRAGPRGGIGTAAAKVRRVPHLMNPSDRPRGRDSVQIEMQPQSFLERGKRSRRKLPDRVTVEMTHRNRTNLFRLSLRLTRHTRFVRFDENLKREHMCRVTRQRHHSDHPLTEPLRRRIGAIITHHNSGSTLGRFTALRRIKINPVHLTPADHSPSAEVTSQSSSTPPSTKAAA